MRTTFAKNHVLDHQRKTSFETCMTVTAPVRMLSARVRQNSSWYWSWFSDLKVSSISGSVQVDLEVQCTHRFSVLNSLCETPKQEIKYITHYTGFKSYKRFRLLLEFILLNLDRSQIINWDSK